MRAASAISCSLAAAARLGEGVVSGELRAELALGGRRLVGSAVRLEVAGAWRQGQGAGEGEAEAPRRALEAGR